jgi:hypothetical protein
MQESKEVYRKKYQAHIVHWRHEPSKNLSMNKAGLLSSKMNEVAFIRQYTSKRSLNRNEGTIIISYSGCAPKRNIRHIILANLNQLWTLVNNYTLIASNYL